MSSIDEMKLKAADFMTKGQEGATAGGAANPIGGAVTGAATLGAAALKAGATANKTPSPGIIQGNTPNAPIQDKTEENIVQSIPNGNSNLYEFMKQLQEERWAREDERQAHVEAREDNAIQRKVADMKKAGVNPNLALGMTGAASGGGVVVDSGMNLTPYEIESNKQLELLKQYLENDFKGDENTKDRYLQLFNNLVQTMSMAFILGNK